MSATDNRPDSGTHELTGERFGRRGMLLLLVAVTVLFVYMVRIFLVPVILAAVFTSLVYPLNLQLRRTFRDRRGLAAMATCLMVVIGVMIPFYITANFVRAQAIALYANAAPGLDRFGERLDSVTREIERLRQSSPGPVASFLEALPLDQIDWDGQVREIAAASGSLLASMITGMSLGTVQFIVTIFIILFTMFYFLRDGDRMVSAIRTLSPLDSHYEELLIQRFGWVSRATLRGQLILAGVQACIGVVTLWICGIPAPLLWGIAMMTVSVIPMVGTWLVMYPLALAQLLGGNVWQGTVIIVVTAVVISNIDNILRPRLVGQRARMHDLMVFFSTLGGLYVYGITGFIVGPIIGAFFMAALDIYALEFRPQLSRPSAQRHDLVPEEE